MSVTQCVFSADVSCSQQTEDLLQRVSAAENQTDVSFGLKKQTALGAEQWGPSLTSPGLKPFYVFITNVRWKAL